MKKFVTNFFWVNKPIGRWEFLKFILLWVFIGIVWILPLVYQMDNPNETFIKIEKSIFPPVAVMCFWTSTCMGVKRLWHITASRKKAIIIAIVCIVAEFIPIINRLLDLLMFVTLFFIPGQELEDIEDYQERE